MVVAGAGVAVAMFGGASGRPEAATPVVTATVTAIPTVTEEAPPPVTAEPEPIRSVNREEAARSWSPNGSVSGIGGEYSHAGPLNSVTSIPFTQAVGEAYAQSGASGRSTTVTAYSPVTGRTYRMSCEAQADTTVVCTGGNNARVLLW